MKRKSVLPIIISALLPVLLLFVLLLAGCSGREKQGFYGTIYYLDGTMTQNSDNSFEFKPSNTYDPSSSNSLANVKLEATNFNDYNIERGQSNGLGNYCLQVKPAFYLPDDNAYYMISSADISASLIRDEDKSFIAFVMIDSKCYTCSPFPKYPLAADFASEYYPGYTQIIVNEGKFNEVDIYMVDKENVTYLKAFGGDDTE